ncbi:sulfite exporter TauE/SafE family protein [Candidatus Gracilibacteria bacterium]|nr:sulfite exporter TauE/SafE family protein [Candidatus Gracilibacteria bacterium]
MIENFFTNPEFLALLPFVGIGFIAQLIDGGIGMGFGIISNSIFMSLGIPPAVSSASIHTVQIFTTGVSGFFHWKQENVEKSLFLNLVITGVIGGILGALFLSWVNGDYIKPFIALYLLILGVSVLKKAISRIYEKDIEYHPFPLRLIGNGMSKVISLFQPKGEFISSLFARILGFVGGILDAIGGGGWGPVVTSTLIAKDHSPRYSIGSVNAAEFFLTFSMAFTFLFSLGMLVGWQPIVGLLIGGGLGAPISSYACRRILPRFLMLVVGFLIISLSIWILYNSLDILNIGTKVFYSMEQVIE